MRLVLCFFHVFTGALVFALPNLSLREMLFAVHVPASFRDTQEGRHAVALYRGLVAAAVIAGLCLDLASPAAFLNWAALLAPALLLLAGGVGFYRQHQRLRPFAVVRPPQRSMSEFSMPNWSQIRETTKSTRSPMSFTP